MKKKENMWNLFFCKKKRESKKVGKKYISMYPREVELKVRKTISVNAAIKFSVIL